MTTTGASGATGNGTGASGATGNGTGASGATGNGTGASGATGSGDALLRNLPDHLVDLDEWDAMPEELCRRSELVEGVLHVSPRPSARHQRLARLLADALDAALDPGWCTVLEVDVVIEGGRTPTLRAPDVCVLRRAVADDRPRQHPGDVLAVVEVLSPGTRRTDRVAKLAEYAEVGIAHYLLVEPGPPVTATELRLQDGRYEVVTEHRGRADLTIGDGAPVDLGALDR